MKESLNQAPVSPESAPKPVSKNLGLTEEQLDQKYTVVPRYNNGLSGDNLEHGENENAFNVDKQITSEKKEKLLKAMEFLSSIGVNVKDLSITEKSFGAGKEISETESELDQRYLEFKRIGIEKLKSDPEVLRAQEEVRQSGINQGNASKVDTLKVSNQNSNSLGRFKNFLTGATRKMNQHDAMVIKHESAKNVLNKILNEKIKNMNLNVLSYKDGVVRYEELNSAGVKELLSIK